MADSNATAVSVSPTTPSPAAKPRSWLKALLIAAACFAALVLIAVLAALMYFNNDYFKEKIQAAMRESLGRDATIGAVDVKFSGRVAIQGITIPNAAATAAKFQGKDTARIAGLTAELSVWSLLTSGFKNINGAKIRIDKPEILVERRGVYPMDSTNLDDLIAKFTAGPPGTWPKQTGLTGLDADVEIVDGVLSIRDPKLGESRVEKLNLSAKLPALGQPLAAKVKLALKTPENPIDGSMDVDAKINFIDEKGVLDPGAFKDILVNAALKEMDIPYLARYARVNFKLNDGKYDCTLGKPHTGTVKVEGASLAKIGVKCSIDSDGAISILENNKWVAGKIPGHADISIEAGFAGGKFQQGPISMRFLVASSKEALADPARPELLDIEFSAGAHQEKSRTYTVVMKTTDELFSCDVGSVLGLKDKMGGALDGRIEARIEESGHVKFTGDLKTVDGYVAVEGVRQKSSMDVNFGAVLEPNEDGRPERAEISFLAKAGSFEIGSTQPVKIGSIANPKKLTAEARMKLKVLGREFFKEFGPLLAVFNMSKPLEESLEGELYVTGSAGNLHLEMDCTLAQQSSTPLPHRLIAKATYDGAALVDEPTKPYLDVSVQLKSAADKSIDIRLPVKATRGKTQHIFDVPEYVALGELKSINLLNARFGEYVGFFFGPRYSVSGYIQQKGSSRFVQNFGVDGKVASSELTLNTDLQIAQFALNGPPLAPDKPALKWEEKENVSLQLGLAVKTDAKSTSITLKPLNLKSTAISMEGEVLELLKEKLSAVLAAEAPQVKDWIDVMPQSKLDVSISPDGVRQLQNIGVLPNEPLAQGDLMLKVAYNQQAKRAAISALRFRSPALNLSFSSADLDAMAAAAFTGGQPVDLGAIIQALPSLSLELSAERAALDRLKSSEQLAKAGLLATDLDLINDFALKTTFDKEKQAVNIESLVFHGPGLDGGLIAPNVSLQNLPARLDKVSKALAAQKDLTAAAELLSTMQLSIQIKAPLFDALTKRGMLPGDPVVRGQLNLDARYDAAADRLTVENAQFVRDANSTLPVHTAGFTCEGVKVQAVLADLPKGPLALLPHFEKGIAFKPLSLSPVQVVGLMLRKQIGGAVVNEIASTTMLRQDWSVQNLVIRPTDKPGVIDVSFDAATPLAYHARTGPGQPASQNPTAVVGGTWKFDAAAPLRLDLNGGQISAQGTINLDGADIAAKAYGFEKAAGTPCSYSFAVQQAVDGTLRVPAMKSLSGPWTFILDQLVVAPAPATAISLERFSMSQGPMKGTVTDVFVDEQKDRLRATLDILDVDVGQLYAMAPLSANLAISGNAKSTQLSYDGKISSLKNQTVTAADKFSLQCKPFVRAECRHGADAVNFNLFGDINADLSRLSSKALNLAIERRRDNNLIANNHLIFALDVTPKTPGELLLNAVGKPGLPLLVRVPVRSDGPVNLDILQALDILAASAKPNAAPSAPGDMSGIKDLRVETALTAPALILGNVTTQNVDIPSVVLDQLMVAVPNAKLTAYGGQVSLSEATYNLASNPMAHSQKMGLAGLDINALTGKPADKTSYEYFGRLSGNATLAGTGFDTADRKSWTGNLDMTITELVAQKHGGEATKPDKLKEILGGLGKGLGDTFTGRALDIFSEDFGLFLNKMELEPVRVLVSIDKGFAKVQRGNVIGKAGSRSEGLQIDFEGSIHLPSQAFKPEFKLWIIKLPPTTQQKLRLHEIEEADRNAILAEFAAGKYEIIMKGPTSASVTDMVDNKFIILNEFMKLDERVSRLIKEKKAREGGAAPAEPAPGQQAAEPAKPPPEPEPEKPKDVVDEAKEKVEDLLDGLFKKKKKKE